MHQTLKDGIIDYSRHILLAFLDIFPSHHVNNNFVQKLENKWFDPMMMKEVSPPHAYINGMPAKKKKKKKSFLNSEKIFPVFPNSHTLLRLTVGYHEELGQQCSLALK